MVSFGRYDNTQTTINEKTMKVEKDDEEKNKTERESQPLWIYYLNEDIRCLEITSHITTNRQSKLIANSRIFEQLLKLEIKMNGPGECVSRFISPEKLL